MSESVSAFEDFRNEHSASIESALQRVCDELSEVPDTLREAMSYTLLLPGKRIRPLLVLMSAQAVGRPLNEVMPAACAVEMVHAFSLIHDDLPAMDDDDLRRGKPTCHTVYGEAQAILAGDALLAHAFSTLSQVQPEQHAASRCQLLAEAAGPAGMTGGQSIDIEGLEVDASLEMLDQLHGKKTGVLIRASALLGIAESSSNSNSKEYEALSTFGRKIGLAFQIMDDVLDVESSSETLGKTAGKDATQGKVTYVSLLGVEGSREKAHVLLQEARSCLDGFDQRADPLRGLTWFIGEREN